MPDAATPSAADSPPTGERPARAAAPAFAGITASGLAPSVRAVLERAQAEIDDLAGSNGSPASYENTIQRLDDIVQRVEEELAPVTVLLAVAETPELRDAYNAVLPEIAAFWSRLPLHRGLWAAVRDSPAPRRRRGSTRCAAATSTG